MLAQEVVREYGRRARFVVEDFGASPIADRFGIDKYPAVFVDDALVSRPEDFYAWGGAGKGKYLPWTDVANRRKFQNDLKRMIDIRLAGGTLTNLSVSSHTVPKERALPSVKLTDLSGKPFTFSDLRGKPVLVEFWATWCPPCLHTMSWMKELDPATTNIVAIAVESERGDVDRVIAKFKPPGRIAMGSAEILEAFGGLPAVPTLFLADANGKIVRVFYGAPPNLHAEITRELAKLR